MKISKLKIKNLFGISEFAADARDLELNGVNGTGKTSVIDAIRYALKNSSGRDFILRSGESEGEILLETTDGISIVRKLRPGKTDYKSIRKNGVDVQSPETFLRNLFTDLQLNPIEFLSMPPAEQNRVILDLIEFPWDKNWIIEKFGELVPQVDYDQNILAVLHAIQADNGYYFTARQSLNRDIRNKLAMVTEISASIPGNYDAKKWEAVSLGEIYAKIEEINSSNSQISSAKMAIKNYDDTLARLEAQKDSKINDLRRQAVEAHRDIDAKISELKRQIAQLSEKRSSLDSQLAGKITGIETSYSEKIAELDEQKTKMAVIASSPLVDTSELIDQAHIIESMKGHLNEYRRMREMQLRVEELQIDSDKLTRKIELARSLPGEILKTAKIPINGLTVENGIPLINGLPVSNLSEGEKLRLCVQVAASRPHGLQIILIDGIERLSSENRATLYQSLKDAGIQFISTRTSDDSELTVIEL